MKIVTFNIRCDRKQDGNNGFLFRKLLILEKIKNEKPDIICFQEVLPHVATWLKENLVDYYVIGGGRSETLEDEQLSIAYTKAKINLLKSEIFWLSETPNLPGSRYENQSKWPRICTTALFQDLETKKVFRVYNIHLDHAAQEARQMGLKQILERVKSEDFLPESPVILLGDFNATPNSEELELLKEHPVLIDQTADIGCTFHDFGKTLKGTKIDYIITHSDITCENIGIWNDCVNGVYLSDHFPVWAKLGFK